MTGGGKFGGTQLGFTSVRYHLAFLGYAVAVCASRTPAYQGLLRRVLDDVIEHLLDYRCWCYVKTYWSGADAHPFKCSENIMYHGHLLQLVVMYEAMLGDPKYRTEGFTATDPTTTPPTVYKCNTLELAEHIASLMEKSPSGGVPCEPGAVFFPCQTHPHVALRMLETMGNVPTVGPSRFAHLREKFEKFALGHMRAPLRTGGFQLTFLQPIGMGVPFGHAGMDAWSLTWYYPWARSAEVPKQLWRCVCEQLVPWEELGGSTNTATTNGTDTGTTTSGNGTSSNGTSSCSSCPPKLSSPPNMCCLTLNIPVSTWAAALYPAVAQIEKGEAEDVKGGGEKGAGKKKMGVKGGAGEGGGECGIGMERGAKTACGIRQWLEHTCMAGAGVGSTGTAASTAATAPPALPHIVESVEWSIGSTANYLLGLSVQSGSDLRSIVQRPLPRGFFNGPLVADVNPCTAAVHQAYVITIGDDSDPTDAATAAATAAAAKAKGTKSVVVLEVDTGAAAGSSSNTNSVTVVLRNVHTVHSVMSADAATPVKVSFEMLAIGILQLELEAPRAVLAIAVS
jgi:hypothetical protein